MVGRWDYPQPRPTTYEDRQAASVRRPSSPEEAAALRVPFEGQAPQNEALERRVTYVLRRMVAALQQTNIVAAEPAFNAPHYYSNPVDRAVRITVPAAVTGWTEALAIRPDSGQALVLNEYGWNVRDSSYDYGGAIELRLTKNGQPVPGLEAVTQQRGSLVLPAKTFILAADLHGDYIQVLYRRTTAAASTVDVDICVRGHTWRPLEQSDGPGIGRPY